MTAVRDERPGRTMRWCFGAVRVNASSPTNPWLWPQWLSAVPAGCLFQWTWFNTGVFLVAAGAGLYLGLAWAVMAVRWEIRHHRGTRTPEPGQNTVDA